MASQEVLAALETLHREIEKLEPAIKHVETAQQVTQAMRAIPQKHTELLIEIKNNDAKHKEELKKLFTKELLDLTDENKRLQKTTTEIQQQVKLEQEALARLRETVRSFHERVAETNFPERLDKLDVNAAGILVVIRSIQNRLVLLEGNISDRLKNIHEYQKEMRTILYNSMEQTKTAVDAAAKKQQIFSYITWALIVATIGITILIKYF